MKERNTESTERDAERETKGYQKKNLASTLSQEVALHISVIIFAGPDIPTVTLERICNHVIN